MLIRSFEESQPPSFISLSPKEGKLFYRWFIIELKLMLNAICAVLTDIFCLTVLWNITVLSAQHPRAVQVMRLFATRQKDDQEFYQSQRNWISIHCHKEDLSVCFSSLNSKNNTSKTDEKYFQNILPHYRNLLYSVHVGISQEILPLEDFL